MDSFDPFNFLDPSSPFESTTDFEISRSAEEDSLTSSSPNSYSTASDGILNEYYDYATSPSSHTTPTYSSPPVEISLEPFQQEITLTELDFFSSISPSNSQLSLPLNQPEILSPSIAPSLLFNNYQLNQLSSTPNHHPTFSHSKNFSSLPQDFIGTSEEISRILAYNEEKKKEKEKLMNSFETAGLLFKPLNLSTFDSYAQASTSTSIHNSTISVNQGEKFVRNLGVGRGNGRRRSSASSSGSSVAGTSSLKKEEKLKAGIKLTKGRGRGKGKATKLDTTSLATTKTTAATRGRKSSINSPTTRSKKSSSLSFSPSHLINSLPSTGFSNQSSSNNEQISLTSLSQPYFYSPSTNRTRKTTSNNSEEFEKIPSTETSTNSFASILARLSAAEKKSLTGPPPLQISVSKTSIGLGLEGMIEHVEVAPLKNQFNREWEEIRNSRISEGWKAFGVESRSSETGLVA